MAQAPPGCSAASAGSGKPHTRRSSGCGCRTAPRPLRAPHWRAYGPRTLRGTWGRRAHAGGPGNSPGPGARPTPCGTRAIPPPPSGTVSYAFSSRPLPGTALAQSHSSIYRVIRRLGAAMHSKYRVLTASTLMKRKEEPIGPKGRWDSHPMQNTATRLPIEANGGHRIEEDAILRGALESCAVSGGAEPGDRPAARQSG